MTKVAISPPMRSREQGIEHSGIAVGGEEADELEHHDQRSGRGFGKAEAVEHLAGFQPAIMLDRLLPDIGEHRIGAAEGDHRRRSRRRSRSRRRHCRGRARDDRDRPGSARWRRQGSAALNRRSWPTDCALGRRCCRAGGAPRSTTTSRSGPAPSTTNGKGAARKNERDERGEGEDALPIALERARGDPLQRLEDDRQHRGLQPEQHRRDRADIAGERRRASSSP